MRDAGFQRRQTKLIYPNHRLPPWLFFVWSSRSYIHVLARHRRVKGVTLTRLTDSRPLPLPVANYNARHPRSLEPIVRPNAIKACIHAAPQSPFRGVPTKRQRQKTIEGHPQKLANPSFQMSDTRRSV
jgi:hypothetical protein